MTADLTAEQPALCPQPDCDQPAGHDDGFHSLGRGAARQHDVLIIWAETQADARQAAWDLQLNPRRIFCVGNRSANSLRGLTGVFGVLVLPGADSSLVQANLDYLIRRTRTGPEGVPWLDLRGMRA